MKQYTTFEDLQALGTEKIHEQTHISRDKVELVMGKAYSQIGRVQFMGYISILEREYGIDLSGIKEEYTAFCQDNAAMLTPKPSVILQATSNSKPKWILAGIAAIALLIGGAYLLQGKLSIAPQDDVMHLTTSEVAVADQNSDANVSINDQNETNLTAPSLIPAPKAAVNTELNKSVVPPKPVLTGKQLSILPKYKVWYGMIDTSSGVKTQNITKDPIVIDTAKDWLIVFGHGRVEVENSEGKTQLDDKNTVYFACEKGSLKQITQQDFMERNGGKNW